MNGNLEKVVNLLSLINKQIDPKTQPEEANALKETLTNLIDKAKVAIEQILGKLEKEIVEGKITDQETIQKIRDYRDKYNAL